MRTNIRSTSSLPLMMMMPSIPLFSIDFNSEKSEVTAKGLGRGGYT